MDKKKSRPLGFIESYMALMHREFRGTTQGGTLVTIDKHIGENEIMLAGQHIFNRFHLLSSRLEFDQGVPFFSRTSNFSDTPIIIKDLEASRSPIDELLQEVAVPLDSDKHFFKMVVLNEGTHSQHYIFVFFHSAMDMDALHVVLDEFYLFLDLTLEGKKLSNDQPSKIPDPIDALLAAQPPQETEPYSFSPAPFSINSPIEERSVGLVQIQYNEETNQKLDRFADEYSVQKSSLLATIIMFAAYDLGLSDELVPFKTAVSLRQLVGAENPDELGCYLTIADTPITLDDTEGNLVTVAKDYESKLMYQILRKHSSRTDFTIEQLEKLVQISRDASHFSQGFGMTNMGQINIQSDYPRFKLTDFTSVANRLVGTALFVAHLYTFKKINTIGLVYTKPLIEDRVISELACRIESLINQIELQEEPTNEGSR